MAEVAKGFLFSLFFSCLMRTLIIFMGAHVLRSSHMSWGGDKIRILQPLSVGGLWKSDNNTAYSLITVLILDLMSLMKQLMKLQKMISRRLMEGVCLPFILFHIRLFLSPMLRLNKLAHIQSNLLTYARVLCQNVLLICV